MKDLMTVPAALNFGFALFNAVLFMSSSLPWAQVVGVLINVTLGLWINNFWEGGRSE